jgi:hypothetical protein
MNRLNIKLYFWNIGGLKSKTHNKISDPIFLQHIFKHDIILLAETLVFNNDLFNKIKDRAILVMRGGRLDWRIINKTSINVFFKIKQILFKDKPVKVRIHDG